MTVTPAWSGNGVLLYKHYSELQQGKHYAFSIQVCRDNDCKVVPELLFRVQARHHTGGKRRMAHAVRRIYGSVWRSSAGNPQP